MKEIKHQAGFTLVEICVAMIIFLLGLLPLCRLQYATIQGNSYAYQLTRATNLAEQKMEALLTGSYDSLTTGTITPDSIGRYTITWSRNVDSPIAGTTSVKVTVTWSDSQDKSHSISLDSIKGE